MKNDFKNECIDYYNQVTKWFINDFNFVGATNVTLSFDSIDDVEFTITWLVDNYFKCTINYVDGRNNFVLGIFDTQYGETILNYMTQFNNCGNFSDALSHSLIIIAQLIENSDY